MNNSNGYNFQNWYNYNSAQVGDMEIKSPYFSMEALKGSMYNQSSNIGSFSFSAQDGAQLNSAVSLMVAGYKSMYDAKNGVATLKALDLAGEFPYQWYGETKVFSNSYHRMDLMPDAVRNGQAQSSSTLAKSSKLTTTTKTLGVIGVGFSVYDMTQNGIGIRNSTDAVLGTAALIPGPHTPFIAAYFVAVTIWDIGSMIHNNLSNSTSGNNTMAPSDQGQGQGLYIESLGEKRPKLDPYIVNHGP